jgi:hypothetical protein
MEPRRWFAGAGARRRGAPQRPGQAGGCAAARALAGPEGFVVITSRASYEMVGKTARAGVALLAAVSGVTGLAIDTAQQRVWRWPALRAALI